MGTLFSKTSLIVKGGLEMNEKYLNFAAVDFAKDQSFLQWQFLHNEEDEIFWKQFLVKHPHKEKDILRAIEIVNSMKANDYQLSQEEKDNLLLKIHEKHHSILRRCKIQRFTWGAIAACITIIVASLYWMNMYKIEGGEQLLTDGAVEYSSEFIQLITSEGEILSFNDDVEVAFDQTGKLISKSTPVLSAKIIKEKKSDKNKLIVPRGKRSFLTLEDHSKVWVNSGSTIEFPTVFEKEKREIAVKGEIYIEVEKDAKRSFYIHTPKFSVNVLGTKFDLSAYEEDRENYVVLVEGSVKVCSKNMESMLSPNQIVNISGDDHTINNINVYDYISWKDGLLQFRSKPLSEVLVSLSRYYNVDIQVVGDVGRMKCTGKLVLFDDIDKVLFTLSNTVPIKYEKTDVIRIQKKE